MNDPGWVRPGFAAFAEERGTAGTLLAELSEGVATLTLNRPERRNSLTHEMARDLLRGLVVASGDPQARVIVLRGAGGTFCAGDDVATVERWRHGDRAAAPFDHLTSDAYYLRICEAMLNAPKPVVAAVEGAAAGAGADIACAADYRLLADSARIGSCLVGVGHVGHAVLMSRLVGPGRATEIYLTGRLVPAAEALAIGLADRVAPAEHFDKELAGLVGGFAQAPTRAIGLFKELRERSWGQPATTGLRLQDAYHLRTHAEVQDSGEGLRAFTERRPPNFTGD
ncbi:enoyl-CoA hydratase/isomerase family protein [Catenulispora rubra]|uniref:enoyl-CoA hydratase/isomerase family protein n=1 Tax=Catenulispora rubra TaxID=280293 RepID=UPI001892527D|nr:enoyl-CoA hydratase-related protein [Catenulispora rubra]